MKVRLLPSLAACVVVAMLWPSAVRAQAPEPTPTPAATPPALDVRGETLPGNVIAPGSPVPAASLADDKKPAAARTTEVRAHSGGPQFMGSLTCSSSLCHGGGSLERGAYTIWKKSDPHHQSAATLAGTRAARIAQGLALASAGSNRCTECHEPLAGVPEQRLAGGLDVRAEGVSCESCHGAAQNWMRSHTRRDFTHAQNVQTGVREVRNLYARANACVACHQVLAADILAAGHPPLLFELDAQTVAEPRHWADQGEDFGPRAWLTGQAVALREMSWSLGQSTVPIAEDREQWRALLWLLQRTVESRSDKGDLPALDAVPNADALSPGNVARTQAVADEFARAAAHLEWTSGNLRRCLDGLSALDKEFVPAVGGESALALRTRAQRLALALSRLLAPLQKQDATRWMAASHELDKTFTAADARAIFDGDAFAAQLRQFHDELAKVTKD